MSEYQPGVSNSLFYDNDTCSAQNLNYKYQEPDADESHEHVDMVGITNEDFLRMFNVSRFVVWVEIDEMKKVSDIVQSPPKAKLVAGKRVVLWFR